MSFFLLPVPLTVVVADLRQFLCSVRLAGSILQMAFWYRLSITQKCQCASDTRHVHVLGGGYRPTRLLGAGQRGGGGVITPFRASCHGVARIRHLQSDESSPKLEASQSTGAHANLISCQDSVLLAADHQGGLCGVVRSGGAPGVCA